MYKGDIKNFPVEIVERMLWHQVDQGNKRNVSVFEKASTKGFSCMGFTWEFTIEGFNFWSRVIRNKNFQIFFNKYPKQKPLVDKKYLISFDYSLAESKKVLTTYNIKSKEFTDSMRKLRIVSRRYKKSLEYLKKPRYGVNFDWLLSSMQKHKNAVYNGEVDFEALEDFIEDFIDFKFDAIKPLY